MRYYRYDILSWKKCCRAIELHVESLIKQEKGISSENEKHSGQTVVSPVPMALVSKAVAEYKNDPLMQRVGNCCLLEKAILVAMCKHYKVTDTGKMSLEDIWGRFCDLIDADNRALQNSCGESLSSAYGLSSGVKANIPDNQNLVSEDMLSIPPYHIFEDAIERLCYQSVLLVTEPTINKKTGFSGPRLLHECLFTTKLEASDVVAALNKHKYLKYL